ncbi:hypothetical protein DERP_008646 [Dermatophagoides pteronyssinus]|uniref:Uncharacterized protein n=1 Tax=Dermatophagoides pteronyssinus TaxID=6956 RepID=A0ABQ8IWW5_DERPT|nr:hypothetical protein DERP_008646 [Dermatophagoides pteronyssinus]
MERKNLIHFNLITSAMMIAMIMTFLMKEIIIVGGRQSELIFYSIKVPNERITTFTLEFH